MQRHYVSHATAKSMQKRLRVSSTTKFCVYKMVRGTSAGGCVSYPLSRSLPSLAGHNGIKITEEIQFPVGYVSRSSSSYSRGRSIVQMNMPTIFMMNRLKRYNSQYQYV